ncbi:MAG: hypothetical protein PHF37_05700 [Phycisphaerae bacterium]|nr:hypothetical protein [Phycisphaerae bacterium]
MQLNIVQDDTDANNYIVDFVDYCKRNGVKTQEQLEQRFDALACGFAAAHNGNYDATTKTLTIMA